MIIHQNIFFLVKSNPEPPIFIYIGEKNEQYEKFETVAESYVPNLSFYYIPVRNIGIINRKYLGPLLTSVIIRHFMHQKLALSKIRK